MSAPIGIITGTGRRTAPRVRARIRAVARDERGFTLIELLATSLLLSLVLLVIGAIFLSVFTTQSTVRTVTASATDGQLAVSSIENGIRNSSEFQLTDVGADQLLVARTAGSADALAWYCIAWYYSDAEGSIRMTRTDDGAPITTPSAADLAGWTLLTDGVAPRGAGTQIFTTTPPTLAVAFDALADDHNPTAFELTVTPLTRAPEAATCY